MKQETKERAIIFGAALAFKLTIASLFYGSIDFIVSLGQTTDVIAGRPFNVPYFPLISFYLWLSALLTSYTPLPLGFCFKLFPALFSSLTALLIYDILKARVPRIAFVSGLLFALSPVTLIVDSLHFQWDSIVLFFLILSVYVRDYFAISAQSSFWSGAFFALAALVKPYSLMVGFFAVSPLRGYPGSWKKWIVSQLWWGLGFICAAGLAALILSNMGYSLLERWNFIREYGDAGIVIFGLPKTGLLNEVPFLLHRTSVLAFLALLIIPYHLGWLSPFTALGISFGLCLSVLGLAPQYLGWILPFLLLTGCVRSAAIYSFVAAIFLALYYAHPQAPFMQFENMATFAPLKFFDWLTPTVLFWDPGALELAKFMGNYLVPFAAALCVLALLYRMRGIDRENLAAPRLPFRLSNSYLLWSLAPFALGLVTWLTLDFASVGASYGAAIAEKQKWFQFQPYQPNPYFMVSIPGEGSQFNIVNLLIFFTFCWCFYCWTSKNTPSVDATASK